MKKTIIALVALSGMSAGAEYTSNSVITIKGEQYFWDENGTDNASKDAFSLIANKTASEIASTYTAYRKEDTAYTLLENAPIYQCGKTGSGTALNSKSITLSSLYNSTTLEESLQLVSYSFVARPDDTTSTGYLQVSDTQGNVLGVSDAVTYTSNTNGAYNVGTFSFEGQNITLSSTAAYTYTIVTKSEETGAFTPVNNFAYGEFNPYVSSSKGFFIDGNSGYQPIVSIKTQSIPEPTTATLSLLALAGLAARRRRK